MWKPDHDLYLQLFKTRKYVFSNFSHSFKMAAYAMSMAPLSNAYQNILCITHFWHLQDDLDIYLQAIPVNTVIH